jgi:hypothetical protein
MDLPWICPSPTKLLQELSGSSLLGAVAVVCFILLLLPCFFGRAGIYPAPVSFIKS